MHAYCTKKMINQERLLYQTRGHSGHSVTNSRDPTSLYVAVHMQSSSAIHLRKVPPASIQTFMAVSMQVNNCHSSSFNSFSTVDMSACLAIKQSKSCACCCNNRRGARIATTCHPPVSSTRRTLMQIPQRLSGVAVLPLLCAPC